MAIHKFDWQGSEYFLFYNGEAMFEIQDLLPDDNASICDNLEGDYEDNLFRLACGMVEILTRHGRLEAQRLGMEPLPLLFIGRPASVINELDLLNVKLAILQAVNNGLHQDIQHHGPVDVDELEEARTQKKNRADYLRMAIAIGLTATEALRMPPGVVYDLFELYLQARPSMDADAIDDYEEE